MTAGLTTYPVQVEGRLDPGLSRWLWLVKWLLAIPHYVVLAFLWIAFVVLSVVAFFAILFTGRYPRAIFDFNVGVLRWSWRVASTRTARSAPTATRPSRSRADRTTRPRSTIEYPERLSRGLALVKWWLLAIPHYLVVAVFLGGGLARGQARRGATYGGGLDRRCSSSSPAWPCCSPGATRAALFDLVLGLNRWVLRVAAYAAPDDRPLPALPPRRGRGGTGRRHDPRRGRLSDLAAPRRSLGAATAR